MCRDMNQCAGTIITAAVPDWHESAMIERVLHFTQLITKVPVNLKFKKQKKLRFIIK